MIIIIVIIIIIIASIRNLVEKFICKKLLNLTLLCSGGQSEVALDNLALVMPS